MGYYDGNECEGIEMKTNIKIAATAEQAKKIGVIAGFAISEYSGMVYIYIEDFGHAIVGSEEHFKKKDLEEIDPELFIRTNGKCD